MKERKQNKTKKSRNTLSLGKVNISTTMSYK